MSEEQRVQCPKCGLRFRVPPERVPEGQSLTARCRKCSEAFDVRKLQGRIVVDVTPSAPAPPRTSLRPDDVEAERLPGGFQVGDRVGRYEIEGLAGRGGMGTVYRAFDPSANRHVALKVLRGDATELDRLRFEREIAVQANIRHAGIMPIFDSGTVGDTRFYAMELLHDPVDLLTLTERVQFRRADDKRLRRVSSLLGVLEHVLMPICGAVHHANEEGVLHRDIKPINVMVDRRNLRPYLIDFGVSSLLEPHNPRMAHIDESFPVPLRGKGVHVTGTLMFMPPEQARGEADRRGDVWGLGALLHFLVTGAAPFDEAVRPVIPKAERIQNIRLLIEEARAAGNDDEVGEFQDMLDAIERGAERTVEQLRRDVLRGRYLPRPPGLDPVLDAIIAKAMHRDAAQRYDNAGLLHDALREWLAAQKHGAAVRRVANEAPVTARPLWRRPVTVALAGLLVVGGGAAVFWPRDKGPDPATVAAGHLSRAQRLRAAGDLTAAQRAVRDALDARPTDEGLALWDQLREQAWQRAELRDVQTAMAALKTVDLSTRERDRQLGALAVRIAELQRRDRAEPFATELLERLAARTRLHRALRADGFPEGTVVDVAPWSNAGGVAWKSFVSANDAGGANVEPGRYVVRFRRAGRDVFVPAEVRDDDLTVSCPVDPARLPMGLIYVGGGSFTDPSGATHAVPPLLWEKHEVTMARYAEFLDTLSPEQRRERVPRVRGDLGAHGEPVWRSSGDRFQPPTGALRLPVENVSAHDARAFAAFAKRRLPTAAEWAWAAAGPFAPATPVGDFATVAGRVRLRDGMAGVAETAGDRNVFGLFDMTGNLAEFTATQARDEVPGWVVKGGSYAGVPAQALVHAQRAVPGWIPQAGVGLRLVTDLSALAPEEDDEKK